MSTKKWTFTRLGFLSVALATAVAGLAAPIRHARTRDDDSRFLQTNLVSDVPGMALFTDPQLVNPWGISHSPASPFWVSDNGTGVATLYNTAGTKQRLVVTIPPPAGDSGPSAPTGQVFNGSANFEVASGKPAFFIFATEDGTISGWNPSVNLTRAILKVDNSASGAVYKGLAIGSVGTDMFLYAANFRDRRIDVFDKNYKPISAPGAFFDKHIKKGYAPFNITNLGGFLFVSYALQDEAKHDDVPGKGHGFVDVFDTSGNLLKRLIKHGRLNSPWGMTFAPASFGEVAGMLLVGNFGDGRITAYEIEDDEAEENGQLRDVHEKPIVIDGLWALIVGNGKLGGDASKVYFTAGIDGEQHGLFGSIEIAP